MASLTGQTIASTYDALLKITDNGPITVSLKQITDGLGNNTPLYLSATTVFVDGNFRLSGPLYDTNNNPGTNGQILVSTGSAVDWQNLSESGLITGSGTATFIPKFTSSSAIGSSIISESVSGIGIGITATQKLHVDGNGLFTGTLTASNVSGSTSGTNTGDETNASIKTKLGQVSAIQDGYLSSVDYESFTNKVPNTRTITINGETFDLSANRTYSVNVGVTSFNTRTGAVVLSSSDVTTALGYTPALESRIMTINGVGYSLAADRSWSVGTVTSVGTSAPLTGGTITGAGTIGITQSGAAADGYLSSTDWNTFNNKQAALGYTPENVANKGVANGYASLDGAGKVPSTQLPSYVDDVVEVANYAALPATGETGKIYITLDTNFVYRWSGSVYVKISEPNAVWGSITGTLSNQTDLQNALDAKVNNTRTLTINGTEYDLSANRSWSVGTVTSVSGTGTVSGLSLSGSVTGSGNLTLGGTLSLTSSDITTGLGYTPVTNARTLSINGTAFDLTANRSWNVGTVTSVGLELGTTGTDANIANSPITSSGNITLNLPTASASNRGLLSSTDWATFNAKQNALTLTTTGNSGSATLVGSTLNIPTYTLAGLGGQPLLTNPVTGTGTSGYLTRFTGTTTVGNSVIFDNGSQIGIGTASPDAKLFVDSGSAGAVARFNSTNANGGYLTGYSSGTAVWDIGTSVQVFGSGTSTDFGLNTRSGFLGLGTANTERMRITSAGNVGIGTTSPTTKLDVNGIITTTAPGNPWLKFNSTSTISTNRNWDILTNANAFGDFDIRYSTAANIDASVSALTIKSSGNVGIGTTSPSYRLDVQNGSDFDIRLRSNAGGGTVGLLFETANSFSGTSQAYIKGIGSGSSGLSELIFGTAGSSGATTATERMRIAPGGNVGIGTSSPGSLLDVVTPGTAVGGIKLSSSTNTNGVGFQAANAGGNAYFGKNSSTGGAYGGEAYSTVVYSGGAVPMSLYTNDTERMRITSGGDVGIGTTPASGVRLHVSGGLIRNIDTYNNTTATAANLVVSAGGTFERSTSSIKYKKEVIDYDKGLNEVMQIRPVYYKGKSKSDGDKQFAGLIAEEIHELGLEEFVQYAEDGSPDALAYTHMVAILVKAIQEQQAQIEELKAKLK